VSGLLRDEARRNAMSENAYKLGRIMVWSNTAARYMRSFELARRRGRRRPANRLPRENSAMWPHESPGLNPDHLCHVTDSTGIFRHANFTVPNPLERYWTGDNARAFLCAFDARKQPTAMMQRISEFVHEVGASAAGSHTEMQQDRFGKKGM
jgi:hypothetical protein